MVILVITLSLGRNAHHGDVSPPLELTTYYPKHQSPCLLLHGLCRTIEFFNPMYDITYKTDIFELSHRTVYYVNHGLFLLGSRDGHHVFFLDPFTKVRIEIPNIPSNVTFGKICFTSSSTFLYGYWIYNYIGRFKSRCHKT